MLEIFFKNSQVIINSNSLGNKQTRLQYSLPFLGGARVHLVLLDLLAGT